MTFFAPSAPSTYVKFTNPGDSVSGYIEEVSEPFPVLEFNKDTPKLDSKGNPVMQVRVIMATDQDKGEGDDGGRSLYISGWRMRTAIGDAMKRAGEMSATPQPGSFLKLTFARLGQASHGMAPPKVYVAEYTKPSKAVQVTSPVTQAQGPRQPPTPPQPDANLWGGPQESAGAAPW
ncbi:MULTISPECIES: hypothetical protein [unclassified Streptomyces]|uniref:hypothetical protein n=1 Tax=unclassified Streptomyces TaxID=2593676 RepID=UPI0022B044FD|nr:MULTISPECIES: hypothetical protein [unclassified Streptomyces]MCZ4097326.1 hypothetical protein [Streptomyces sp. H39-C1]MCZ4120630.1 hypothetical protein [Streptomyces sp. H39-S7]